MTIKKLKRRIQKFLYSEQWSLVVCDAENNVVSQIRPPRDRIWADPFPVVHCGKTYVFIEQQFARKNGTLGYIELRDDFSFSEFTPILERDYHLSYPNVFSVAGKWYMIPETHERRTIDLYRAESFPDGWVHHSTLIENVEAVDTTLYRGEGKWWLFTSVRADGSSLNDSLSVFSSDVFPSTRWIPHPLNPVVKGLGGSRMAGNLFVDARTGKLVRPAQSCAREYGEHMVLREVASLSADQYSETEIGAVYPERNLSAVCTHTINRFGDYIVRDIKTRVFMPGLT